MTQRLVVVVVAVAASLAAALCIPGALPLSAMTVPLHSYSDPDTGETDVVLDVPDDALAMSEAAAIDEATASVTTRSLTVFHPIAPNPADPGDGDDCYLQVNLPHSSYAYPNEVHTRITSACSIPLTSNTVSAKTYRHRWYGWQKVAELAPATARPSSGTVQNYRRTIAVRCGTGSYYQYLTEGFGTITDGSGQSYSAQAYEKNDSEIECLD